MMAKRDLASLKDGCLKQACSAGESLDIGTAKHFLKETGLSIREGFGQTETALILATAAGIAPKHGSIGKPTVGLFSGYYQKRQATEAVWRDGFYHTGDLAYCDENGYFHYIGRTDDVINSAGYRIGPFEIENVLTQLPYVEECGITSVNSKRHIRGETIKACIVLAEGVEATESIRQKIRQYAKEKLASYKRPKIIEFWSSLPKTASGKIRHDALKKREFLL